MKLQFQVQKLADRYDQIEGIAQIFSLCCVLCNQKIRLKNEVLHLRKGLSGMVKEEDLLMITKVGYPRSSHAVVFTLSRKCA